MQERFEKLTEREREVLEHVLPGALKKQISDDLGICERPVQVHHMSLKTKVGVQSAAELAQLAQEARNFPKGQ